MAKKSFDSKIAINEAEPIVEIKESAEESAEETKEIKESAEESAEETKEIKEVESTSAEKLVKITTLKKVECIIGDTPYKFDEGKQASVPLSVACILCSSGKAYRI